MICEIFDGKKDEEGGFIVPKYPGKHLKISLPSGQKYGAGRKKETREQVDLRSKRKKSTKQLKNYKQHRGR